MRKIMINRLSLLVVIGALLTVMTGSVSAATQPEVSVPSFSYMEMDGSSCPYSSHGSSSSGLSARPVTQ
ncbi:MAG: hypothetical protein AAF702_51620 [Chloroflexota bacterium]